MVNPSTESILNQMTNLAMDIALDYVLPASPMSDVCKSDLFEFERDVVVAAVSGGPSAGGLLSSLVAGTAGTAGGCCGRPPTDLCKKNSYMGAAGCDSCDACLARNAAAAAAADLYTTSSCTATSGVQCASASASPPSSTCSSSTSSSASSTPSQQQTAETTMDISWCQFDGCEFDTADNSYLDICDWIFYADRYALTDENREKVQKAFQMVPPGEVTGYVAEPAAKHVKRNNINATAAGRSPVGAMLDVGDSPAVAAVAAAAAAAAIVGGVTIKSEPDDDYLWTSDNHLQPIILKAEPNADILQITELDHSYLQTPTHHHHHGGNNSGGGCGSTSSSTAVSPAKHHPNHLVDMLGLVTPPPSRSQSSEEEEIDVVNDSWDTPDTPRKGATMADIMKRGIVKKREPPVTKWKSTVKRKHKTAGQSATAAAVAAAYPMPPPPPKKLCGGLSLLDRYKKDNTNWKGAHIIKEEPVVKEEPVIKEEPVDDYGSSAGDDRSDDDEYDNRQRQRRKQRQPHQQQQVAITTTIKPEPLDEDEDREGDDDEDDDYDMDADFESLMKNEPDDMFDDDYDDYDDDHDMDWDKVLRGAASTSSGGRKSSGGSSSCSSSSTTTGGGRKKKKKKKKKTAVSGSSKSSSSSSTKLHHHHQQPGSGKKMKYENVGGGGYSYKTKLMDPVKRALHNDLEKSRRVETSMLFMNLSMQVSFLDDNRKIPSKLSILRGAKRECDLMMLDERRLLSEKHVMQQKQRMLRERLFELRREHYHRRYGKPKQQTSSSTPNHFSHNQQQHHQQQQ